MALPRRAVLRDCRVASRIDVTS